MKRKNKSTMKALAALNLDLFRSESLTPPAPATLYSLIREQGKQRTKSPVLSVEPTGQEISPSFPVPSDGKETEAVTPQRISLESTDSALPPVEALYLLFDRYNWMYFSGKLPRPRIEYSKRMMAAGSYTPSDKLIKIGKKYHEIFPEDINDTLKHEIIHMIHLKHDAAFKKEAKRIGASLRARSHPDLQRKPKHLYECPVCKKEYPRQKRLRMASCGSCSRSGKFDRRFKLKRKTESIN